MSTLLLGRYKTSASDKQHMRSSIIRGCTMVDKERKRRTAQKLKRRRGVFCKSHQLGKLCGLNVAVIVHDPEEGQYYVYRSTDQESWPPSLKEIVSLSCLSTSMIKILSLQQRLATPRPIFVLPSDIEEPGNHTDNRNERNKRKRTHSITDKGMIRQHEPTPLARQSSQLPEPPTFDCCSSGEVDQRRSCGPIPAVEEREDSKTYLQRWRGWWSTNG